MKNFLKNRQFFNILLLIFLAGFLILPKICLANDFENINPEELSKYLELPRKDANKLMDTLRQVFTTEGILAWSSGEVSKEKTAVAIILLKVTNMQALSHLLVDAPIDITEKIINNAVKIARIFLAQDIFVVLDELEKESVKRAVNYGMDALLQKEIKVTPGAIKFKYFSYKGGEKEIVLQYVMIYKPESEKRAKVVIRFYMPNSIEAPDAEKYNKGITSLPLPDLKKDLPPFIVDIQGKVEKTDSGIYSWTEGPSVDITFPDDVPDLGIKPLTFWQRHLLKPFMTQIKNIEVIITKVTGISPKIAEKISTIPGIINDTWNKIVDEVKELTHLGGAQVGSSLEQSLNSETGENTEKEVGQGIGQTVSEEKKPEIKIEERPIIEEKAKPEEKPEEPILKKPTLDEIQEMLDNIAEEIDIANQKVAELIEKSQQEILAKEQEKKDKQKEQEAENNENNKENEQVCTQRSININTASKEDLDKLVGIGSTMAQRIIDARPFYLLSDLTKVNGIGQKTLEQIITQGCAYVDGVYSSNISSSGGGSSSSGSDLSSEQTCLDKSININTASKEELDKLVGIGPVLAQRIIEDRPFSSVDDLTRVEGIGEIKLEDIKDQGCAFVEVPNQSENQLPIASFVFTPAEPLVSKEISFNAASSSDVDGNIVDYIWDFGDSHSITTNLATTTYSYATSSDFIVGLYVVDDKDATSSLVSKTITVAESSSSPLPPPPASPSSISTLEVVINEIAWVGTKANSADEWIELYNNASSNIDLDQWTLTWSHATTTHSLIFSTSTGAVTIPSHSYFLMERSDDNTVQGVDMEADQIFKNGFHNNGEKLELRDANGVLIDIVDCSNGWFAGDNDTKQTMERINSESSGSGPDNWASNTLITRQGLDVDGNSIYGTPKAENSVSKSPTEITELPFDEFSEFGIDEITLESRNSPFIVKNSLTVPEGKTLNIKPGVILKFYDKYNGITVDGTLTAIGGESDEEKITFTSYLDNPYPGSWNQIYFTEKSLNSELKNVIIEYAGGDPAGTPCSPDMAGIKVEKSSINITDSIIEHNQYRGIYLVDSSSTVDYLQFTDNPVCCPKSDPNCHDQYGGYGLEIDGGAPTIKNSLFKGSVDGIYINKTELADKETKPIIEDNNFEWNERAAIWLSPDSFPSFGNNQAVDNGINGIFVLGNNSIVQNTIWKADLPYIIQGTIDVPTNVILTLEPGAILKFYDRDSKLTVNGTLTAIGDASNKIVFTSFKDNPQPGDWGKIYFGQTSTGSELNNVIVSYGGGCSFGTMTALEVKQSDIAIKNSIVENNKHTGLYFIGTNSSSSSAATVIDNVQFSNNKRLLNGNQEGFNLWIDGNNISVKNSSFKNGVYGIFVNSGEPSLETDSLTFGTGNEANTICNIYKSGCINP